VSTFEGHQSWVNAVALSADGRYALSGSDDNTLKVWNISSGHVLASFTSDGAFFSLALHPDGYHVLAGDVFGRVHLLEVLL
jgi:WD40 repeat protein